MNGEWNARNKNEVENNKRKKCCNYMNDDGKSGPVFQCQYQCVAFVTLKGYVKLIDMELK